MEPNSTNGVPDNQRESLDSLRQAIERLEAELCRQQKENEKTRQERDEYRKMLVDIVKPQLLDRTEWEQFTPEDFKLTIDDLLAVIDEYKE
jgi:DNA-directed RNA polymerase specialized sigma subunit